jgi:ubiquinone/menaquinone biosynthesis C-methylase UbiE
MKLNVGCGNNPSGDVNCDLYIEDVLNHRDNQNDSLNARAIPNFVKCDCLHLPFKNQVFSEVISQQVIEHLDNPLAFLKESARVCEHSGQLVIETVHRYGERIWGMTNHKTKWLKQHHVSHFNIRWFKDATKILGCRYKSSYVITYVYFPNEYFTIFRLPFWIGVVLIKEQK